MGDFDSGRRPGVRLVVIVLAAAALAVGLTATGVWIGGDADSTSTAPASTAGAAVPPPWPLTNQAPGPARVVGTADAGQGWQIPNPVAAGPFSVTDQGVPYGYRQDMQGAALAAVNAVIAGKYLAAGFVDPWSALGFLADPRFAERGGNPSLEAFFTGPVHPQVIGDTVASAALVAATEPTGGGRVLGVQTTASTTVPGAAEAVVLWQSFAAQYRPDGQQGYTVRITPVSLLLVWVGGDWKVATVGGPPIGMDPVVLDDAAPLTFPVPAEGWHR